MPLKKSVDNDLIYYNNLGDESSMINPGKIGQVLALQA